MDIVTQSYVALEARLRASLAPDVKTLVRVPTMPDKLPSQPAGVLLEMDGSQTYGDGGAPDVTTFGADLTIFFRGSGAWPGGRALELVRLVRRALRWKPEEDGEPGDGYATTLGGLVLYARVVSWDFAPMQAELPQWAVSIEIELAAPDVDRDEEP